MYIDFWQLTPKLPTWDFDFTFEAAYRTFSLSRTSQKLYILVHFHNNNIVVFVLHFIYLKSQFSFVWQTIVDMLMACCIQLEILWTSYVCWWLSDLPEFSTEWSSSGCGEHQHCFAIHWALSKGSILGLNIFLHFGTF
jgi:hypothetical protein